MTPGLKEDVRGFQVVSVFPVSGIWRSRTAPGERTQDPRLGQPAAAAIFPHVESTALCATLFLALALLHVVAVTSK